MFNRCFLFVVVTLILAPAGAHRASTADAG